MSSTTPSPLVLIGSGGLGSDNGGSDSIILDTFVSLFWYIIGSIIFCICCISCLLLFYIQQTRRYNGDNNNNKDSFSHHSHHSHHSHSHHKRGKLSESSFGDDNNNTIPYQHQVSIQSNTSKHKLVISAPMMTLTKTKSPKHPRMRSAFSTISALSGLQSPKTPRSIIMTSPTASGHTESITRTNTITNTISRNFKPSPRHSRMRRKAAKTQNSKRTRARKRARKQSRRRSTASSTACESSSEDDDSESEFEEEYDNDDEDLDEYEEEEFEEESTSSDDESTTISSTTHTRTPDGHLDTNNITSPNENNYRGGNKFPEAVISVGSSLGTDTSATNTLTHIKNPLSFSAFSGVDSDGIDIQSFVDELNMPTIPEINNDDNNNFNSSQDSTPSPRSASNSSILLNLSPVRKVIGIIKIGIILILVIQFRFDS